MAAFQGTALLERAEAAHVLGYLGKPVRQADLEPAIALAMRRFAQLEGLREAAGLRQALAGGKGIEPTGGGDDKDDAGGHQPTVALVEDDERLRLAMAAVFVREGYLVLTAGTAHDALGAIRSPLSPIDVVVLDVHLPDASGAAPCARVRELYPSAPVIPYSGEASPEEAAELLRLGARRYLQQPVSPDGLLATVEAALP